MDGIKLYCVHKCVTYFAVSKHPSACKQGSISSIPHFQFLVTRFLRSIVITVSQGYKHFVYRLVLYLMVADLLQALTNILESLPVKTDHGVVKVQPGTEGQCATYGFINQLAAWSENVVICWIMAYILVLVARIARVKPEYQSVDGTKTASKNYNSIFGMVVSGNEHVIQ